MRLVTITSDWNKCDYYLPVLKGRLYSLCQVVGETFQVVDISNTIKHFDVFEACFVLKHSFGSFPYGTIHIMAVSKTPVEEGRMVVAKAYGQYFIGLDDGRFPLLFGNLEQVQAFGVDFGEYSGELCEADIYCRAVEAAISGKNLIPVQLQSAGGERPVVMADKIVGRVVYIDSYGNAITNISKYDFLKVYDMVSDLGELQEEPEFTIYVGGPHLTFEDILYGYSSVPSGNNVAFFNSLDLLELAVNGGDFASLEGVDTVTEVLVKFKWNLKNK